MWSAVLGSLTVIGHMSMSGQVRDSSVELQRDISRLDSLRQSGNLDTLEASVSHDSTKWRQRDQKQFVKYMFQACSGLSSYEIGDTSRRALLLSKYAGSVLGSTKLSIEENVQFVEFLSLDPPVIDEKAWRALRGQKARLWLAAWRRVNAEIDPSFNFDDRPYINVPTPAGSGVPSGSVPESIKDVKLRTEYERAIAENSAKIQRYNDQHYLKQNAPRFFTEVERYLVSAYSRSPVDLPQLNALLTEYVGDEAVRKRILDEVSRA